MNIQRTPKVAAVIIHWNQEELTRSTILSLLQIDYPELTIILVDNGSDDGSGKRIAHDFQDIRLVQSDENLGYAGGSNLGLGVSLKTEADYHFLLNNDVEFDPKIIKVMVQQMETKEGKDIGLCVPKIFYHDEPLKIWYAGGDINPKTGICCHNGFGQIDGQDFNEQKDCTFATGCAMLIRRETLENVGFFDTNYFHTGEDTDYSVRLKAHGFRILFVPQAHLWHKIRSSVGGNEKPSFHYLYYENRNQILIMKKYFRDKFDLKSYLSIIKFFIRKIINEIKNKNPLGVKGIYCGVFDGLKGVYGKKN